MWRTAVAHARPSGQRSAGAGEYRQGSCGCSGSRSRRSRRPCGRSRSRGSTSPRWRSRPACAAARSRSRRVYGPADRGGLRRASPPRSPQRHADTIFSTDGSTIDEQVAGAAARAARSPTAESCTGGLLAARLTERAGSSEYVLGGPGRLSERGQDRARRGAGGADRALRRGLDRGRGDARRRGDRPLRLGAGSRGHGGRRPRRGTPEKPVGFVCVSVSSREGERLTRSVRLPGSRQDIRERTTTVAMHMLRRLLLGESDLDLGAGGEAEPART